MNDCTPWHGWAPPRRPPAHQSQPVKWWLLISSMEDFSTLTGAGLAGAWAAVHRGDYLIAHQRFTQAVDAHNEQARAS